MWNPARSFLSDSANGGAHRGLYVDFEPTTIGVGEPAASGAAFELPGDTHNRVAKVVNDVENKATMRATADSHAQIGFFVCVEALLTQAVLDNIPVIRLNLSQSFKELHLLMNQYLV